MTVRKIPGLILPAASRAPGLAELNFEDSLWFLTGKYQDSGLASDGRQASLNDNSKGAYADPFMGYNGMRGMRGRILSNGTFSLQGGSSAPVDEAGYVMSMAPFNMKNGITTIQLFNVANDDTPNNHCLLAVQPLASTNCAILQFLTTAATFNLVTQVKNPATGASTAVQTQTQATQLDVWQLVMCTIDYVNGTKCIHRENKSGVITDSGDVAMPVVPGPQSYDFTQWEARLFGRPRNPAFNPHAYCALNAGINGATKFNDGGNGQLLWEYGKTLMASLP